MFPYPAVASLLISCPFVYAQAQERDAQTTTQLDRGAYVDTRGNQDTLRCHETRLAADALPIDVMLEVLQDTIVPGENIPVRLTIHNPNMSTVYFAHVGYEQPHLFAAVNDEELCFVGRAGGVNPDAVISPVLEPGESATAELLMFPRLTGLNRFEPEGGYTLRLCAGGAMHGYTVKDNARQKVTYRCRSKEIQVTVRVPTASEQEALSALRTWERETHPEMIRREVSWGNMQTASIEFYRSFLERFGDTPYAKEVQVVLGLILQDHIQRHRNDRAIVDEYEPLLIQCVNDSLDRGPAYSPVVSRHSIEAFASRGQWDTAMGVVEALLAFPEEDRTVDSLVAHYTRSLTDIDRLQKLMGLPEGEPTERLKRTFVRSVERCLTWNGYRATGFGETTFQLLCWLERWDLLERAARQTLKVGDRGSILQKITGSSRAIQDNDLTAARTALRRASESRARERNTSD